MSKATIRESKAGLDAAIRAVAETTKRLPFDKALAEVNRRCHTAVDPAYLRELRAHR